MSTRANIGYVTEDGLLHMIYCHYDGYPRHVGSILHNYHSSLVQAKALVSGAQIRNFDSDGSFARFGDGEGGPEQYETVTEALNGFDYAYIFEEGAWHCYTRETFGIKEIRLS